jgi:serine/threonine protein kinase
MAYMYRFSISSFSYSSQLTFFFVPFFGDFRFSRRTEPMSSSEDTDDATSTFEGVRCYARRGGFRAVAVGEHIGRWRVDWKLGFGRYATVWRVTSDHAETAAMKIYRADADWWKEEVAALTAVRNLPCIVQLLATHSVSSPNGEHGCIVMTAMGSTLHRAIFETSVALPTWVVRGIARDILTGLAGLHGQRLIHTDLKPDNVLLRPWLSALLVGSEKPQRIYCSKRQRRHSKRHGSTAHGPVSAHGTGSGHDTGHGATATAPTSMADDRTAEVDANGGFAAIADLGNALRDDEFPPRPGSLQARAFRAPEVVLYMHHDARIDVFSFGVILQCMHTRAYPFDAEGETRLEMFCSHVQLLADTLGACPEWMRRAAPACARPHMLPRAPPKELHGAFAGVAHATLRLDPTERPTASEALSALLCASPMSVD